jgi:hypothetical protein
MIDASRNSICEAMTVQVIDYCFCLPYCGDLN